MCKHCPNLAVDLLIHVHSNPQKLINHLFLQVHDQPQQEEGSVTNFGSELLYTPSFGSAPSQVRSNQEIYHKPSHSSFRTQQTRKKIITPMGTGYKAQ